MCLHYRGMYSQFCGFEARAHKSYPAALLAGKGSRRQKRAYVIEFLKRYYPCKFRLIRKGEKNLERIAAYK